MDEIFGIRAFSLTPQVKRLTTQTDPTTVHSIRYYYLTRIAWAAADGGL